jgi:DNA-binding NarL/FixJ family response regulator
VANLKNKKTKIFLKGCKTMRSIRPSKKVVENSMPDAVLNIIGRNMLQNELLFSFLINETGLKGRCAPNLKSLTPIDENEPAIPQLMLLDCKSMDMENLWADIRTCSRLHHCPCFFVLFNAESDSGIEKRAMNNGIQGIFYNSDPMHFITKGIGVVLNGDLWYSRKTFKKLLMEKHASAHLRSHPAASLLTPREKQVLSCIASGYTSKEIAQDLEISVQTVKTHIYNIYKKIEVTDRLQASLWASKYL